MTVDSGPAGNGAGAGSGGFAASDEVAVSGGRMSWAAAVSGPLAGCTCLWQDLDGLHVEPASPDAPPTSILWGWRGDAVLVRIRLDGEDAYVAVLDVKAAGADAVTTVAWAPEDGRVAAAVAAAGTGRGPGLESGGVGARYEQVIPGGTDAGPITFVRPAGADATASSDRTDRLARDA